MTRIEKIFSNDNFVQRNNFARSLSISFEKWGSLTEKQENALYKAYNNFLRFEKIREANKIRNKKCEFVGSIGERINLNLTLERTNTFNSRFGETTLFIFRDEQDNIVKWFTSSRGPSDFEKGITYKASAIVKKHEVYEETKSTQVTRLIVRESISLPLAS